MTDNPICVDADEMNCTDCGADTSNEYYMVHHELWFEFGPCTMDYEQYRNLLTEIEDLDPTADDFEEKFNAQSERFNTATGGFLCIRCLETRMGRELNMFDFIDAPVNRLDYPQPKSDLLLARLIKRPDHVYGKCVGCGSVEVELTDWHGQTLDLSYMGEHPKYPKYPKYPVGYGCEVCG